MPDLPATIETWKPNRRTAALLLAQGYTWDKTAEYVGVVQKTIANWLSDPDFAAWVETLRVQAVERVETALHANFEMALDIQRRMYSGEIEPRDERYREARDFINRFVDKAYDAGAPPPPPAQATQFNVYTSGRDET